jgi:hypothetical protein
MTLTAAVISGRIDPLKLMDWREYIKLQILEFIFTGKNRVEDFVMGLCQCNITKLFIQLRFGHDMALSEVYIAIRELYRDGLIEAAEYKRECCKDRTLSPENILNRVTTFSLTEKGRAAIPEQTFP